MNAWKPSSIEAMGARFIHAWHRLERGERVGEAHSTALEEKAPFPQDVLETLERYSKREIGAQEAMAALDVRCLEDLYGMALEAGLGLPRIDREAAEKLSARFLDGVR